MNISKLKSRKEIKKIVAGLKRKGKKIVFTNGCFDILHYGHVKYLEKCKKFGDFLIVGLNSDSSVKKIKGRGRPLTGENQRAGILSALESVDFVTIFGEKTPEGLIKELAPDVLAKGGDWKTKNIVGGDFVKSRGGKVRAIPFVKGYSTTSIINKIKRGRFTLS